jgi:hypothetical protein
VQLAPQVLEEESLVQQQQGLVFQPQVQTQVQLAQVLVRMQQRHRR